MQQFYLLFVIILCWGLIGEQASAKMRFDDCLNCTPAEIIDFLEKTSTPNSSFSLTRDSKTPQNKSKVLLLHGLTDSPYYLKDIAKSLYFEGYDVFVPLLSGHGKDEKTMGQINYEQWLSETKNIIHDLTADGQPLILGGFSNGGLLSSVLVKDIEIQNKIKMLLLFAPALEISTSFASKFILSILRGARKWISASNRIFLKNYYDRIRNFSLFNDWCPECSAHVKNKTLPLNGPLQVYNNIRDNIKTDTSIKIPTVLVMTGNDSVIDSNRVVTSFTKFFNSEFNHIFWLTAEGDKSAPPKLSPEKLTIIPSSANISHSGLMFETNEYGRLAEVNPEFHSLQENIITTMNSISKRILCKNFY